MGNKKIIYVVEDLGMNELPKNCVECTIIDSCSLPWSLGTREKLLKFASTKRHKECRLREVPVESEIK
jgi:hypothetical protein